MRTADLILQLTEQVVSERGIADVDTIMDQIRFEITRTCEYVMPRGKRKGEVCARRSPGKQFCKIHSKTNAVPILEPDVPVCKHIYRSGKFKNDVCKRKLISDPDSGLCSRHRKRARRSESVSTRRPVDSSASSDTETDMELIRMADPGSETEFVETVYEEDIQPDEVLQPVELPQPDELPSLESADEEDGLQPKYSLELQAKIADPSVPRRVPLLEYGSDNDSEWDESDLTEIYAPNRSWGCQYWNKSLNFFCLEPTVVDDQFCGAHKRYAGKIPYKLGPHNYPMLEIDPVYYKTHNLTGQYWYPRLLFAAKPTKNGLVVIGRLLGQRWIQALTRREIKRCHNNGLLYKVLPQEVVHYNYHIPDVDEIPGKGFTNYEQIRTDRPRLYLKYWKIWNQHIQARKDFFQKYKSVKDANKWRKDHTCPLPDWKVFEREYAHRGLRNVICPLPTLEQVQQPDFDAWDYCKRFDADAFPPFYLDFPKPLEARNGSVCQWDEESVWVHTPRRTKHYGQDPYVWLDKLIHEDGEWMQIYF